MESDERIKRLLGYANPYATSQPIKDCPARPSDFLTQDAGSYAGMFKVAGVDLIKPDIAEALQRDLSPIPATENREGYQGNNHYAYWLSGYVSHKQILKISQKYNINKGRMFDFGGSTGRIFRHFYYQDTDWEVWSCDFKMSSVEWNMMHMPSGIKVFQGGYAPVLPIEDRFFDLVIAMSVFTHIDETETGWLLELRRVMRPGGVAIVTIHDEHTWPIMSDALKNMLKKYSPEIADLETMPPGRHVSTWRIDDPYRCNTFHSNDYIRRQWSRYFDVMDIIPRMSGAQSAVILQKNSSDPSEKFLERTSTKGTPVRRKGARRNKS